MTTDGRNRPAWMRSAWTWGVAGFLLVFLIMCGVAYALRETQVFSHCSNYEFDQGDWAKDADREAASLVNCRTLHGMTRAEVVEMLGETRLNGRPDSGAKRIAFSAGWTNDYMGPGDGQTLYVRLGPGDRVIGSRLALP